MTAASKLPYGSWESPITTDLLIGGSVRLGQIVLEDDSIYWSESRPSDQGRGVIVGVDKTGKPRDLTSSSYNVRTRVHEYGGGAFTVQGNNLYFSNDKDGQVYALCDSAAPVQLTHQALHRFADFCVDRRRHQLICVVEDHSRDGEPSNALISISMEKNQGYEVLATGFDFYASPALNHAGTELAWLCWNHPNMPWDGTELWSADLGDDGKLVDSEKIAGGLRESIFQPQWSPCGSLYFVSDRTNWWNIYRYKNGKIAPVVSRSAEFGLPQWIFGMSTYAIASNSRIVCTYFEAGEWHLGIIDTERSELSECDLPFTSYEDITVAGTRAVFLAASPILPTSIVSLDLETRKFSVIKKSTELTFDTTFISRPRCIEFPTENGLTAHAYFYPPQNRDHEAPDGELPPLIVKSHGGPTASAVTSMELKIQYWTSRGFALLDVNYGGSTGYGRAYRERLNGMWGLTDVVDCVNGAKYIVQQGLADGNRMAIAGGSAGGYTTLCALTFYDFFKAGASYYGISDLEAMAGDTHKFESRYLDTMIGPYPAAKQTYIDRSPIHFTERLSCPLIILQGEEDKVVPPSQAEVLVEALRQKGLPVAYILFAGEQHGFRKADTIKRALEAELTFYAKIFDFTPAGDIPSLQIDNL